MDFKGEEPDSDYVKDLKKLCSTDKVELVSLSDEEFEAKYER